MTKNIYFFLNIWVLTLSNSKGRLIMKIKQKPSSNKQKLQNLQKIHFSKNINLCNFLNNPE